MNNVKWEFLIEVLGTDQGMLLKQYLESCDIPAQTFEEAATSSVIPVTFGRVKIYVEDKNLSQALELLKTYPL